MSASNRGERPTPAPIFGEGLKQRIEAALRDHSVGYKCPACARRGFALVDGYLSQELYSVRNNQRHVENYIPLIATMCEHCGFMRYHSVAALGLSDETTGGE